MDHKKIIADTAEFIFQEFRSDSSGHDWFHVDRVRKMAIKLGEEENADLFIVEMAALLHDLDDWKLKTGEADELSKTERWLVKLGIDPELAERIIQTIHEVSYKGAKVKTPVSSIEAAVVQDADRLDAIGAIGIARAFSYGGNVKRLIYDPAYPVEMHENFNSYKKSAAPTINHFYEKLLLLKDRMNTKTAKILAESRHQVMVDYLSQFFDEWETKK